MHVPISVAALLPSALLPLLLLLPSTLGASVADRAACIRGSADDLSSAAACGDKGSLKHCFVHAPEYVELADLERCFQNAGCTNAESAIEAAFVLHGCDNRKSVAELRRRGPDLAAAPIQEFFARQDTTTTAAATGTTTGTTTTGSIQCSTSTSISTSSCPIQSTGTASGQTLPCFETQVPTEVCAAENICMTNKEGLDVCMRRDNSLDTGEIIVTVILAAAFLAGFATLVFLCCRDKRGQRKLRARQEAAAIAKTNAMAAQDEHRHAAHAAAAPHQQHPEVPYDPPKQRPQSPGVPAAKAPAQNPFDEPRY
ncbi:hypothetical protein F4819DRAFT_90566 [Hypoxylon fuscum]|nr:hypothetical protein F4819DRAFT_90566 [Hypoxylon fuscum]